MAGRFVYMTGAALLMAALSSSALAFPVAAINAQGKNAEKQEAEDHKAEGEKKKDKNQAKLGNGLLGNASRDDVTLAGEAADAFKFLQGVNTHKGNLDTSVLPDSNPLNAWALLGKGDRLVDNALGFTFGKLVFNFYQADQSDTKGSWTVQNTSTSDAIVDLVLSIHASNASGAFLFDNQAFLAGQTLSGSWAIEWFNNGNNSNSPGFSNVAFFHRDLMFVDPVLPGQIPEPGSGALLGLGLLGICLLRKGRKA